MLTLGVIADTHIPDRVRNLNPQIPEIFQQAEVAAILHAGDLSTTRVIKILETIAPVYAVRGNRDLFLPGLPYKQHLTFEGVTIGLTHGHGGWLRYLTQKTVAILIGPPKFSVFEDIARREFPDTDVVVLGHNHAPANRWQEDQLIFNPGSPCCPNKYVPGLKPSVGLLHLERGNVRGEIVFLT